MTARTKKGQNIIRNRGGRHYRGLSNTFCFGDHQITALTEEWKTKTFRFSGSHVKTNHRPWIWLNQREDTCALIRWEELYDSPRRDRVHPLVAPQRALTISCKIVLRFVMFLIAVLLLHHLTEGLDTPKGNITWPFSGFLLSYTTSNEWRCLHWPPPPRHRV